MTIRKHLSSAQAAGHRTRVAAERRKIMRGRLLNSALRVFARQGGAEGGIIDEVIREAEVSRGTFYNYFRTPHELFNAVAEEAGNELLRVVDPVVRLQEDAASRIAFGIRLVLELGRRHPNLAAFAVRGGPEAVLAGELVREYVPRDLALGMASGQFTKVHPRLALDLVLGPVLSGLNTVSTTKVPTTYPQEIARAVLQALGVPKATARRLATRPLKPVDLGGDSPFSSG